MKEFDSLSAFGRHLERLAAVGEEVTHHLAGEAAKVVQADAQARFGEYQDGGSGFPAWANLAPSTVEQRLRLGFTPDDPLLRTGGRRDSIEVEQSGSTAVVGSADPVMLYQEQGTNRIPPRPVLGPAAHASGEKVAERVGLGLVAWIAGLGWKRPSISLRSAQSGPR